MRSWKQHKVIILEFWRPEGQNGCQWANIMVLTGVHFFGGLKEKSISLPFSLSRGSLHVLACGFFPDSNHITPISASAVTSSLTIILTSCFTSLVAKTVKNLPAMQETWLQSLGWEDLLEKEMATHSSVLAWRVPWTEEPGGLQSFGSQRVRHNWATNAFQFHLFYLQGPLQLHWTHLDNPR